MPKQDYTHYQKKVISAYYEHRDELALTSLQSVVTDLFLADTDAKRSRLWDRAHKAMLKLKVKPAILEHILSKKDVTLLAKNLQDWLK
jgi:hypothetical protein